MSTNYEAPHHAQKLAIIHTSILKMEAESTSEASPTSAGYNNPRMELTPPSVSFFYCFLSLML
jgi:hypothetical protein